MKHVEVNLVPSEIGVAGTISSHVRVQSASQRTRGLVREGYCWPTGVGTCCKSSEPIWCTAEVLAYVNWVRVAVDFV